MRGPTEMVWIVEKKVFYHLIDLGFESVDVPVRVKFEFEVNHVKITVKRLEEDGEPYKVFKYSTSSNLPKTAIGFISQIIFFNQKMKF